LLFCKLGQTRYWGLVKLEAVCTSSIRHCSSILVMLKTRSGYADTT